MPPPHLEPGKGPPRLLPGDRLGPYAVLSFIARGAMSEVYRAEGPQGRVALKVPRRPAFVRHLRREGVLLSQVVHPNVARVLDASEDLRGSAGVVRTDELPWIAVELVEGQPLRALCRGTMAPAEATLLADQILAGLGAIHRAGIVHLDLKPENVIVQADGVAKVVDLGLGRAVTSFMAEVYLSASLVSRELPLAGTLAYMPPEQRRGQAVDPRADLYAFGVLLHELLAGQLPDPSTRLTRLRPQLTPRWDVAIARLTHPEPERRPADADEARRLVAFTLAEKGTVPVAEGGHAPRDLSLADDQALEFLSPWVAGMVVGGCELIEPLGRGGYGEVWRARRGEERVAVKLALRDEARPALEVEAAAAAQVQHPGVPRVLDDRTREDPPCVVLELVEGTSLRKLIHEEGKVPLEQALRIGEGMIELLAACHAAGVVHGDVKPEHFIVAPEPAPGAPAPRAPVWLIDFGLARLVGAPAVEASLPTRGTGEARGTFDYMAPEVRRGEPGGQAADVFSLGVCLFELVADFLPRGPQRLKTLRPEVPEEVDALVVAMMDTDPWRRPPLGRALEVLRGAESAPARRLTRGERARWLPFALLLLLAATLGALGWDVHARAERARRAGLPAIRPPVRDLLRPPMPTYRAPAADGIADHLGALNREARAHVAHGLGVAADVGQVRVGLLIAPLGDHPDLARPLAERVWGDWQEAQPPAPEVLICSSGDARVLLLLEDTPEARQGSPALAVLEPELEVYRARLRAGEPLGSVLVELAEAIGSRLLAARGPEAPPSGG